MIFHVRHTTKYHYPQPVDLAAHILRLRPRELPWQHVHAFTLRAGAASVESAGEDHFGNPVARLFLDQAHDSLDIASEAVVELFDRGLMPAGTTPAWEVIAAAAQGRAAARDVAEFVFPSPMTPGLPEIRAWAGASFPAGRPVLTGVHDLMTRLAREFCFQPGVTTVSTPVGCVLALREGACQDFAHLMIAGLRTLGLPARYVSGYRRTQPPAGTARLRGADQLHAWVACWLGPDAGWIELDPANDTIVGNGHVCLAWGRDYADVGPMHGILVGGGAHTMSVSVDMEMVGALPPARAAI